MEGHRVVPTFFPLLLIQSEQRHLANRHVRAAGCKERSKWRDSPRSWMGRSRVPVVPKLITESTQFQSRPLQEESVYPKKMIVGFTLQNRQESMAKKKKQHT